MVTEDGCPFLVKKLEASPEASSFRSPNLPKASELVDLRRAARYY
jgi:hypothetical protein